MTNSAKEVVDKMFAAFNCADVEKLVATVSVDTKWEYHGTHIIPKGKFEKKEGVRQFFTNIFERTEMINFDIQQYILDGNMVVVLGQEHHVAAKHGVVNLTKAAALDYADQNIRINSIGPGMLKLPW